VQATDNLGMAMVYTLVTSAKEWLTEEYGNDGADEESEEADTVKDDVCLFSLPTSIHYYVLLAVISRFSCVSCHILQVLGSEDT
jgi:hypothetical protein